MWSGAFGKGAIACLVIAVGLLGAGCPGTAGGFAITAPLAGAQWAQGDTRSITWQPSATPGATVTITLLANGTASRIISDGTDNSGAFTWEIPADLAPGTQYQIAVNDGVSEALSEFFTIVLRRAGIGISRNVLAFTLNGGAQTVEVFNNGTPGSLLEFIVKSSRPEWLVAEPATGSSTGLSDTVPVSVRVIESKVPAGVNTATLTVTAVGAQGVNAATIEVSANRPLTALGTTQATTFDFGFTNTEWTFGVWNAGEAGATLNFDVFTDKAWATVSPESGASTGLDDVVNVKVTIDRTALPSGTQTARLTIAPEGLAARNISLTATRPEPAIALGNTAHDFGSTESSWKVNVWNSGAPGSVLQLQAFADRDWVSVAPASGASTGESNPVELTVTINRDALSGGRNTARLTISGNNVTARNIDLSATRPVPALSLSSTTHDFGTTSQAWSFDLWNGGDAGSTLNYALSSNRGWLNLSTASGSSTGASDRTTVNVSVDRDALPPGASTATIAVSGDGVSTQNITINVRKPAAAIATSGTNFNFGRASTTWQFDVWNAGEDASVLAFDAFTNVPWARVSPTSGLSADDEDRQTITVTVERDLLQAGNNAGTVSLSSPGLSRVDISIQATRPEPAIATSAAAFDFGGQGDTWPLDVWNGGDPGSTLDFVAFADKDWVSISLASGLSTGPGDPVTLEVTIDRDRLASGNNSASLTLSSEGLTSVNVQLTVTRPVPEIAVSSTSRDFGATETQWTFDVWNSGDPGSTLGFQVFASRGWIVPTPASGSSTGPANRQTITVGIDREALSLGENSGRITVSADGLTAKIIDIRATRARAAIATSSSAFDFGRQETSWTFDVWNSGEADSALDFTTDTDRPWLDVTPATARSTGPEDRITLTVTVDRAALPAGGNSGNVVVSADGIGTKNVAIQATRAVPAIAASATAFDFGGQGDTWPLDVWNGGDPGSTLDFVAFADKDWVSISPASGLSTGPGDPVTLEVTIDRDRLASGGNSARLTLSSEGLTSVNVQLTATRPVPEIAVSSTSRDFGATDTQWTFDVWNSGDPGSTLAFQVFASRGWIVPTPASGGSTGPANRQTITVDIDREALSLGENSGRITVSADGLTAKTIDIRATRARAAIATSSSAFDFGKQETTWTFDVWNAGEADSVLDFTTDTDRPWIDVTPATARSTGPEDRVTLTVTVDRVTLPAGGNSGNVLVSADGIGTKSVGIQATKAVPAIAVSDTAFDFGKLTNTWTFDVWNSGDPGSTLDFQITSNKEWVGLTPETGTSTGAADMAAISVTINRALLSVGNNDATLTVTGDGLTSRTIALRATRPDPAVAVSSNAVDFGTGGVMRTVNVWNSGDPGSTLEFVAFSDKAWITVSPESGSSGGAGDQQTLEITIDRNALVAGNNSGRVTVSAEGFGQEIITVTATKAQPEIALSATAFDFGTSNNAWTFDVWNGSSADTTLEFQVFSNKEWIVLDAAGGTSTGPDDPVTIQVDLNRALLANGSNSATITVSAAGVTSRTIQITATKPQPAISVSGTSFDFGRTATQWSFDVWNSGDAGTTLNFFVTGNREWFTFTPEEGTSTGPGDAVTISVTVNRALLELGVNSGVIEIFAGTGTNPRSISISATTPRPAISVSGRSFDFAQTQVNGSFTLWNSGDAGTMLDFTASSNKEWLTVAPETGTSTGPSDEQTIAMIVDRALLTSASETATVTLSGDGAQPVTVSVQAMRPVPAMAVSSSSFDFGLTDTMWAFDVWNDNDNGSVLEFTVVSNRAWVTLVPAAATSTDPTDRVNVAVTIDRTQLQPGSNQATISINSPNGGNKTVTVNATTPAPNIQVSSTSRDFGKTSTSWTFDLWNGGLNGTVLNFEATPNQPWISVSPASGTSTGPADRVTLTVTVDRMGLTQPNYSGSITLSGENAASRNISISLQTLQPAINTSATSHTFAITESQWTFDAWNSGDPGTTLDFFIVTDKDWISVAPETGTSDDATDPVTITVDIDRGSVPAGQASGVVTLVGPNNITRNISLSVQLPKPEITASARNHDFGAVSTTWAFDVWNSGDPGTTLDFQVADDQLWLDVSPLNGTSDDDTDRQAIDVTINRSLLGAGSSTGNIIITGTDTGSVNISVTVSQSRAVLVATGVVAAEPDGVTWETAYATLGEGVAAAAERSVGEVWVATGTYTETVALTPGLALYGGFLGDEPSDEAGFALRDATVFPAVIDGENARALVLAADGAVLDGFLLTNGFGGKGGALQAVDASMFVRDCTFTGNSALYGGAAYVAGGAVTFENCTLLENVAEEGGALFVDHGWAWLNDCIVWHNGPECIALRGDAGADAVHSNIEDGWPGEANRTLDPYIPVAEEF